MRDNWTFEEIYEGEKKPKHYMFYIAFTLMFFSALLFAFTIGYFFAEDSHDFSGINKYFLNEEDPVNECQNMSFYSTTKCLNKYVTGIYNYTPRDERLYTGEEGTLKDIIENGGDCYDYTNVYIELYSQLGYYAKGVSIHSAEKETGHRFVVAWSKDLNEYCVIDQTHILSCMQIG